MKKILAVIFGLTVFSCSQPAEVVRFVDVPVNVTLGSAPGGRALSLGIEKITLKAERSGFDTVSVDLTLDSSGSTWSGNLPGLAVGRWDISAEAYVGTANDISYAGYYFADVTVGMSALWVDLKANAGIARFNLSWAAPGVSSIKGTLIRNGFSDQTEVYSIDPTWVSGWVEYYLLDGNWEVKIEAYSLENGGGTLLYSGSDTFSVERNKKVFLNIGLTPGSGGNTGTNYTSPTIGTLKYVPAGKFQRDGTSTNISVISQPYRMSTTEITRAQFLAIMGTDPVVVGSYTAQSSGTGDPLMHVNWYHAIAFCNKLSLAEGLTPVYAVTGVNFSTLTYAGIPTSSNTTWNAATATWTNNGYRLPTEMEWMWAAMGAPADGQNGGTNTTGYLKAFAGSTGTNAIGDYAWNSVNSGSMTNPAGTKLPNELGLYDMSGNVSEWCWDWYGDYTTGSQTDYRGPASGTGRVSRGGSWSLNANYATVSYRNDGNPGLRYISFGFRVVRP